MNLKYGKAKKTGSLQLQTTEGEKDAGCLMEAGLRTKYGLALHFPASQPLGAASLELVSTKVFISMIIQGETVEKLFFLSKSVLKSHSRLCKENTSEQDY